MLVLSRRINERIYVGDEIEIVVVDIMQDKVRLGIQAPRHVAIVRDNAVLRGTKVPTAEAYTAELPNPSPALKAAIEGKESGE